MSALGSVSVVNFDSSINDSTGFINHASRSVPQLVQGVKNDTLMPLGRPDSLNNRIVIATECTDGGNYLIFVDGEELMKLRSTRLVLAVHAMDQPVHDSRWIDSNSVVCATAEHQIAVFQLNSGDSQVTRVKQSVPLHQAPIRELAVKACGMDCVVASGGSDGTLNIVDLTTFSIVQRSSLTSKVISSTKWTNFNNNVCVSVTVEDGDYHMFDTRSDMSKAAVSLCLIKSDLFTHCRFTDHHVLLGYGDGEMKQIDMRKPQDVVGSVTDPWVEGIGGIEFNGISQTFAVSGFTDCSVWRVKPDGIASVVSHSMSGSNTLTNQDGYATAASFLQPDMVAVGDSAGRLAIFQQSL